MKEVNDALDALKEMKQKSTDCFTQFNEYCDNFIKNCRIFMNLTHRPTLQIGDTRQGVSIYLDGKPKWYGITTAAVVKNYENELIKEIQKEIQKEESYIKTYNVSE